MGAIGDLVLVGGHPFEKEGVPAGEDAPFRQKRRCSSRVREKSRGPGSVVTVELKRAVRGHCFCSSAICAFVHRAAVRPFAHGVGGHDGGAMDCELEHVASVLTPTSNGASS